MINVWALVLLSFSVLVISPFVGYQLPGVESEQVIFQNLSLHMFWDIRLPRVIFCFLVGAGLGLAGLTYQALFGNSLASPFTLGISAASSLGAVIMLNQSESNDLSFVGASLMGGLTGGMLAALFVYYIAMRNSSLWLIISGIALSLICYSFFFLFQYIGVLEGSFASFRWLIGGFEQIDYSSIKLLLPFFALGVAYILLKSRELDLFSCGEELAYSRGLNVDGLRKTLFFTVSLLTGASVAFSGPIGFVGVIIPNVARSLTRASHRVLGPLVLLLSGSFLVFCDSVARMIPTTLEVPVGIITTFLGSIFLIRMCLKGHSSL